MFSTRLTFALVFLICVAPFCSSQTQSARDGSTISAPQRNLPVYSYRYAWIYSSWVPDAARQRLESIYQKQTEAILKLNAQSSVEVQDQAWDFLVAAFGASSGASGATAAVRNSAGDYKPEDAALTADSPAAAEPTAEGSIYAEDTKTLIAIISDCDKQISAIRSDYGISETIGPPEKPFDASNLMSGEDLARAFLAISSSGFFNSAFDQVKQANASSQKAELDLRTRLNDIANHIVSLNNDAVLLEQQARDADAAEAAATASESRSRDASQDNPADCDGSCSGVCGRTHNLFEDAACGCGSPGTLDCLARPARRK